MNRLFHSIAGLMFLGCLTVLVGALAGCERPLFPEDMPRSQYERYDQLRGQERQAKRLNAYGGEEPNLRERLRPLEQNY